MNRLYELRRRLSVQFRRDRFDRDLDEEMQFHLALPTFAEGTFIAKKPAREGLVDDRDLRPIFAILFSELAT